MAAIYPVTRMLHDVDHNSPSPLRPVDSGESASASSAPAPGRPLTLRPVEPHDGPALHDLLINNLSDVLCDRARWLQRWQWQAWDNPFRGQRSAGWVLADGDRLVGHIGAVYLPVCLGGAKRLGMIATDYVVAPDATARGGVFAGLQLAQAFFDAAGDLVALATTANDKTGAVFQRFGGEAADWTREFWRASTSLAQRIRACRGANSRLTRAMLAGGFGRTLGQALSRAYRRLNTEPAIPIPPGCWLETTVPQLAGDLPAIRSARCDFSWPSAKGPSGKGPSGKRRSGKGRSGKGRSREGPSAKTVPAGVPFRVDRSLDYFQWRYVQHPQREQIRVITVRQREGQPIGGVIVFCEDRGTQRRAYVEDLLLAAPRPDIVRTLYTAALRHAAGQGADYLVTTTGRADLRPIFWELGFESRARNAPAVVVRLPAEPASEPSHPQSLGSLEFWHGAMF